MTTSFRVSTCAQGRLVAADKLNLLLINQDLGGFWGFRRLSIP
jgi:hypothetical protein